MAALKELKTLKVQAITVVTTPQLNKKENNYYISNQTPLIRRMK